MHRPHWKIIQEVTTNPGYKKKSDIKSETYNLLSLILLYIFELQGASNKDFHFTRHIISPEWCAEIDLIF